jgi:hypothetical protein
VGWGAETKEDMHEEHGTSYCSSPVLSNLFAVYGRNLQTAFTVYVECTKGRQSVKFWLHFDLPDDLRTNLGRAYLQGIPGLPPVADSVTVWFSRRHVLLCKCFVCCGCPSVGTRTGTCTFLRTSHERPSKYKYRTKKLHLIFSDHFRGNAKN